MYQRKSAKPTVITITVLSIAVICGGFFYTQNLQDAIETYETSKALSVQGFDNYVPEPFVNSAAYETNYKSAAGTDDALYAYTAPEGFTILSHSKEWNRGMLRQLYEELKQNKHGDEINKLDKIIVYPDESEDTNTLATYTPGISAVSLYLNFPVFPSGFSVDFPIYTGRITIYGGDTKTTIESIAGSLSHEYGHHYTFYYMFDSEMRRLGMLDTGQYGMLRESVRRGLIPTVETGEDYMANRHKYIIEVAAEDYVTLMGSPTTRQIEDYFDVKQLVDNPELPRERRAQRNAFPQENMSLPLAIDVPGLPEYFYDFINEAPPEAVEEKQEIALEIKREQVSFDLDTGKRTFTYYTLSWNTPYKDTVYTLICYDPLNYTGAGIPIKTVHTASNTNNASAVIGEYAARRDNLIHFMDDEIAQDVKIFIIVAQLPDGTYYTSAPYEVNFN